MQYLSSDLIIGIGLGAIIIYLYMKSSRVSRSILEETQQNLVKKETELTNISQKITELQTELQSEKNNYQLLYESQNAQKNEWAKTLAEKDVQSQLLSEKQKENKTLQDKIAEISEENQKYFAEISKLKAQNESLETSMKEQKNAMEQLQEASRLQFENIANKILEEKTEKFTSINRENLDSILKPLGENLNSFKQRVEEVHQNDIRDRASLNGVIKTLMEQSNKISQEANNLASALKGQTKIQGDWGEMILERILENSGLTKDREYYTQVNFKNENGESQRPDFILQLPKNQKVIIDSKVSLNSYEKMISSENPEEQKKLLDLHILAMKNHIDTLAKKQYHKLDNSLDFTIMFVPIESAFLVAMQHDSGLWNYAYNKQVIILSPTNLIAYLKLISEIWDRTYQNENAEKIAKQAADLYDKFVGFTDDLIKIGKKMNETKSDYDNAMKKLSEGTGNLVRRVENIKKMGIKPSKNISPNLIERSKEE